MAAYLFSCDNATCAVPEAYRELFRGSEDIVSSGEGWEPGALNLAQGFAMKFRTPLVHGDVTRLLIDFEQGGDARWSRFSAKLPEATQLKLVDRHERPYRTTLQQRIAEDLRRHSLLLHVMVHTAAKIDGMILLETSICAGLAEKIAMSWRSRLSAAEVDACHLKVAEVSPLATVLQQAFSARPYAQIRLSVSQTFFLEGRPWRWETVKKLLLESLVAMEEELELLSSPESSLTDPY